MNDIRSYIARSDNARFATAVVRGSLARTLAVKLIARTVAVALGAALFAAVSPAAGFVALAVALFIL